MFFVFLPHAYAIGRATLHRQFSNEEEVVRKAVEHFGDLAEIKAVDFASFSLRQQVEEASKYDVFVCIHGAGMTHLMWLPPHAGVMEMWSTGHSYWKSYENLSLWLGLRYVALYSNEERRISTGTEMIVNVERFLGLFGTLLKQVREKCRN